METELRAENITATFRIFSWSGANSVIRRACAADELTCVLASDPDDVDSIVIAHSHGGNVAYRAISKLERRGAGISLITLATPFLRVFPTSSGPGFLKLYGGLFLAAGALAISLLAIPFVLSMIVVFEIPVRVWVFGQHHLFDEQSRLWGDSALYRQVKEWL